MIELTFLREFMLIRQMNQKSALFIRGFDLKKHVCNGYHDLLMMYKKLSDADILNIKNADYCCIITKISKVRP